VSRFASAATLAWALALPVAAQSGPFCLPTIQPFASDNGGSIGGVVYLDLDTRGHDLEITELVLNTTATGSVGVDVYLIPGTHVGNTGSPVGWALAGSGSGVGAGVDQPTRIPLSSAVCAASGTYGLALVGVGLDHRYTSATGALQTFADQNIQLTVGAASNSPFSAAVFSPRIANLELCYRVLAPGTTVCATAQTVGQGCGAGLPATYYEDFDGIASTLDLAGTSLTMTYTGRGHRVTRGTSAIVAPAGTGNLLAGDDTVTEVTLPFAVPSPAGPVRQIHVGSNGYVFLRTTGRADFSWSVTELLQEGPRLAVLWEDFNPSDPSTLGGVFAELDPNDPGLFHVTWDRVVEFGGTQPNTFQLSLHANGDLEFKYAATNTVASGLVGMSTGGGATDPGATDLSAFAGSLLVEGDGLGALALSVGSRPVLGTTALSTTSNLPASAFAAFQGISFVPYAGGGLDLTILGMPGCRLIGETSTTIPFVPAGGTVTHGIVIPSIPALAGATVHSQTIALAPGRNALGAVVSNAIAWTFGTH
jgi:hypothetical protein